MTYRFRISPALWRDFHDIDHLAREVNLEDPRLRYGFFLAPNGDLVITRLAVFRAWFLKWTGGIAGTPEVRGLNGWLKLTKLHYHA